MKVQRQISDRISALPQDTIENILSRIPIRDALRTSILSRNWRYSWASMPKLVFDEKLVTAYSDNEEVDKYKLLNAIFSVLLLHKGPILEFVVCLINTNIVNEFDQIMLHLSRSNNIKKFIFQICSPNRRYKLPSLFFSLHGLEHLDLTDCVFEPPLTSNGFSMLKKLRFNGVNITAKSFLQFLTNCPLLEEITLIGDQTNFTGGNDYSLVELLECLPLVKHLEISSFYIEHFITGDIPKKLPISLVHLRTLMLNVWPFDLAAVLCVISSSPNLEKIKVEICRNNNKLICWTTKQCVRAFKLMFYLFDYSSPYSGGPNLNHLKELEITRIDSNIKFSEMELVKAIMAKSPLLKKVRIELSTSISVDEEVQMLRDLQKLPYPGASPTAKVIIEGPKSLPMNAN